MKVVIKHNANCIGEEENLHNIQPVFEVPLFVLSNN